MKKTTRKRSKVNSCTLTLHESGLFLRGRARTANFVIPRDESGNSIANFGRHWHRHRLRVHRENKLKFLKNELNVWSNPL